MKHKIRCNICGEVADVNGQRQIEVFGREHRHDLPRHEYLTGNHIELDESASMPLGVVYETTGTNYPDKESIPGSPEDRLLKALFGDKAEGCEIVEELKEEDVRLSKPMSKVLMRGFLSGDFSGNNWRTIKALLDEGMIRLGEQVEITDRGKQWCDLHHWDKGL